MGFDQLGRALLKNNRSLQTNFKQKYFKNNITPYRNFSDKIQLISSKLELAEHLKKQAINRQLILFGILVILAALLMTLAFFTVKNYHFVQ